MPDIPVAPQPDHQSYHIEFVDPLFAVAVHIGLTEGLFHEQWFTAWRLPTQDEKVTFLTWGLGLLTLLLAWVFYHESIRKRPVKGLGRLFVDVLIVILYTVMMVKKNNLIAVMSTLVGIYALYIVWDLLKIAEHPETYPKTKPFTARYTREIVTVCWGLIILALACSLRWGWLGPGWVLALAYGAAICHRVNKVVEIFGKLAAAIRQVAIGR